MITDPILQPETQWVLLGDMLYVSIACNLLEHTRDTIIKTFSFGLITLPQAVIVLHTLGLSFKYWNIA